MKDATIIRIEELCVVQMSLAFKMKTPTQIKCIQIDLKIFDPFL